MGWAGFSRTLSSRGVECRAGRGSCETLPRSTTRSPVVPCMRRAGAVGESHDLSPVPTVESYQVLCAAVHPGSAGSSRVCPGSSRHPAWLDRPEQAGSRPTPNRVNLVIT